MSGFSLDIPTEGYTIYANNGTLPTQSDYRYFKYGAGSVSSLICYREQPTMWYFLAVAAYDSAKMLEVTATQTGKNFL